MSPTLKYLVHPALSMVAGIYTLCSGVTLAAGTMQPEAFKAPVIPTDNFKRNLSFRDL